MRFPLVRAALRDEYAFRWWLKMRIGFSLRDQLHLQCYDAVVSNNDGNGDDDLFEL